jgi:hypothetical protein
MVQQHRGEGIMNKLNIIMYRKLLAQAEEAKEQGLIKLGDNIIDIIGPEPTDDREEYSYGQLQNDIHKDLWKLATRLMIYYDLNSADISEIDKTIMSWASKITDDLEKTLSVDASFGPLESLLPGEDK